MGLLVAGAMEARYEMGLQKFPKIFKYLQHRPISLWAWSPGHILVQKVSQIISSPLSKVLFGLRSMHIN